MTVTRSFNPVDGILTYHISGMTSQEQIEEMIHEVLWHRQECGCTCVLVDATERRESLGMLELFEVGLALSKPELKGLHVAIFSPQPQPGIEFTRSVVSKTRRGSNLRTFNDEKAARKWLVSRRKHTRPVESSPKEIN